MELRRFVLWFILIVLVISIFVLFINLTGCAPVEDSGYAPTPMPNRVLTSNSIFEVINVDSMNTWRIVDKEYNVVCYVSSKGIDCIKLGE